MTRFLEATPAFAVFDLDRSRTFYCGKIGYSEIASGPGFALLHRDGVALHLWLANDEDWRTRAMADPIISGAESFLSGTVSCRIQVTAIRDLYARMMAHDVVHPNGSLRRATYPAWEFAILDPDGNLITFYEMDAPNN